MENLLRASQSFLCTSLVVSNSNCCRTGTSSGSNLWSVKHACSSSEWPQCQVGEYTMPSAQAWDLRFSAQLILGFRTTCAIVTTVSGCKLAPSPLHPAGVWQTNNLHNLTLSVKVTYGITKQTTPSRSWELGLAILYANASRASAVGSLFFSDSRLPVYTEIVLVSHICSSFFSSTTNCPLLE